MRNAIATVCLSGTLEDKLRAAADAGFDAVEIFETDFLACPLTPRELKALLDSLGLTCALYQPFRDFEGMPEPHRSRAFDRARQKFDVMTQLGCDRILLCSNCSPLASGDIDRIVADLRELGDLAATYGIKVGYEGLAWAPHVNDHRHVWEIVKAVDHPNIGIILDSFHSLARGIPNESIRAIDPAKIVFVQLADAPLLDMGHLYWSRHFRNLPGQGGLDVQGYVTELYRIGFDGPLSLEIFNDRFRSNSATMVARDGVRSLNAVRDMALRTLGRPTQMPAPSIIEGIAFVEFAVDPADRGAMEAMLDQAGFARVGTHRAKAVERWRNGDANFVLNFETQGLAGAYRVAHGSAICAIGLSVLDSKATIARAHALGISEYRSDIPSMPAIRGVAGSLVYVIDADAVTTLWDAEFDPVEPAGAITPSCAVEAIDHLAATVHNDEFLSWLLYWRALFDVRVQAAQDVIDPNGLVQSQAIQNASGTFRLTINTTDARDALSARFLTQSFGAGFQHIALRVDNIGNAAAELDGRGIERLPVPSNYYDDARDRWSLDDAAMETARHYDLLIDEDAGGDRYWQFYTRAFAKTFFFEFVERQSAYDGYGAPNAAIRLAAQSRFRSAVAID